MISVIYIYNDYGGTHTTSMAAAYHLKQLPQSEQKLTTEQILNVKYFNKLTHADFGKLIFHGIDDDGNPVYTIGRKRHKLVVPALQELVLVLQERFEFDERVIFSNTSPTVPLAMTLGGFFARGIHINSIGVPLLVMGAKKCCDNIFRLVEHTKHIAKTSSQNERVIILNNELF
jgi:hypothetical protein